jgi:DNA polymerase-4
MAADRPPGTVNILDPATALAFLHQQPVRALPGVGPALERALHRYGLTTVAELAALPQATLQRIAGVTTARLLHDRAHGIDPRRVTPAGPPPSITARRTFHHDVLDPTEARRALLDLAVELGVRLRQSKQCARQVELHVTFADRSVLVRSRTLPAATHHTPSLQNALYEMFSALGLQRARIRAVTARTADLTDAVGAAVQLTLDRATEAGRLLEPVIDHANRRFGNGTLRPAALAPALPRR